MENYQKQLDRLVAELGDKTPSLLLHSCCAPCSSYCIEYLSQYFAVTILYYNPNIAPEEEFFKRAAEQQRLVAEMPLKNPVSVIVDEYDADEFYSAVKGMEKLPEGGERCFVCYRLRLERAARYAAEHGFDYFCSTLSISPLKNAAKLNEIGQELSEIYPVQHLPSDFKKKNGYKRSIELSHEYGLYRQNYCGCVFSKREAAEREACRAE
ncbi:MAG: epoxyqueuosine reductase QueH [Ruminococcaceae bacterium]|nr:epoxyqueuosine reductase QueH [Oscillospiraceae bacterium]